MHRALYILILLCFVSSNVFAQVAEVPFEIHQGHIYVTASINDGKPINMVFDSGARANLLDESVAEELDLTFSGRQTIRGIGGTKTIDVSNRNELHFDKITMANTRFLVMDISHLGSEDHPAKAIIGGGIFDNFVVEINYDDRMIRLFEFREFQVPSAYKTVNFRFRQNRIPILRASLFTSDNSELEGTFYIDTGAALALYLNTPYAEEYGLYDRFGPSYEYKGKGLTQENRMDVARIKKFEFAGQKFEEMPVRMAKTSTGVGSDPAVSGIIGLQILQRFNTFFDYSRRKMHLQPSKAIDTDFHINHSGLKVRKIDGFFHVEDVFPNSPALESGVEIGDIILSIDGRNDLDLMGFHDYFQRSKKRVNLKVKREKRQVKLILMPRPII